MQEMTALTDAELPDTPTPQQVAQWLQKRLCTVYSWCRAGAIPCKRVQKSYIFDKAALLEWRKPTEVE